MSWVKFFRSNSIQSTLALEKKGDIYLNPIIKGKYKLNLKRMFHLAQFRFIFEKNLKRIGDKMPNMDSPFHKFPRGILKQEKELVKRITKVRLGIINAKEKELKWRQEFINKRKYRGFPELIRGIMPSLIKQSAVKTERLESAGGGSSRKVIAESVKGVPKVQKDVSRKAKEHFKNYMDDAVISPKVVAQLNASRSKKPDKFEQFKKKNDETKLNLSKKEEERRAANQAENEAK